MTLRTKINPYVGPRHYTRTKEDQMRFFGRDTESEEIITLIMGHKLVLIYAQSGAGKTSLFNAKIIPNLEKEKFVVLPITRVTGTSETLRYNEQFQISNYYIFNTLQNLKSHSELTELNKLSLSSFLEYNFPLSEDYAGNKIHQVLIFDQFEEIFSMIYSNEWMQQQRDFFTQISEALRKYDNLHIVFIIREEYLAQLDPFIDILPEKLRSRFRLERLEKDAAFSAIKGPLEIVKDSVKTKTEKDLNIEIVDLINELLKINIEDPLTGKTSFVMGQFVEPIQLQIVCQRWWQKITTERNTTNKVDFKALDVDKALEEFYEFSINEVTKITNISEIIIRNLFQTKFITSSNTRSILHKGALVDYIKSANKSIDNKKINTLIDTLEKNYLIRPEWYSGAKWYTLTHDRLIQPIIKSNYKWKKRNGFRKKLKGIFKK